MPSSDITARQFEAFVTLMTSRGLKEAAQRQNCSIAALSKTISALETQTGTSLFERVAGRLRATQQAQELLPVARAAVEQMEEARLAFQAATQTLGPRLRIGVGGGALARLVPNAVRECREAMPSLKVEVVTESTQRLLYLLANHQLDVAVSTPVPRQADPQMVSMCEISLLEDSPLVAAVPRTHRLAERAFIRPSDLTGESLVTLYNSSPTITLIAAAFKEAGVVFNNTIQVSNSVSACYLVSSGNGIALVHREALAGGVFPKLQQITFLPRISMQTYLYIPKSSVLSNTLMYFIERLTVLA